MCERLWVGLRWMSLDSDTPLRERTALQRDWRDGGMEGGREGGREGEREGGGREMRRKREGGREYCVTSVLTAISLINACMLN